MQTLTHRATALQTLNGATMGTGWSVRVHGIAAGQLPALRHGIEQVLDLVIRQMSTWEAGSDLSRYNRAGAGEWVALPEQCRHVLTRALAWAEASGGAFDPSVGPVVNLWGFGPDPERFKPPEPRALAQAKARVGWRRIQQDGAGRVLQPGGCYLDFSGIAKGYAVDLVARELARLGVEHALVEIGGELKPLGRRPDGEPWQVAVRLPGLADGEGPVVRLDGLAIATSGDDYNYFEAGGRRYSHTIDPRTGAPVAHSLTSITVLHPQATEADAIATVLTVLGPEGGVAWAEARHIPALFVARDGVGHRAHPSAEFLAALA